MKKIMKKFLFMLAAATMITASSCAQDSKQTQPLTQEQVEAKLKPFYEKIGALPDNEESEKILKQMSLDFVKENKNEAGTYVVQAILSQLMPIEDLIKFVDSDEYLKNDAGIKEAKKGWNAELATAEGKMFKDFEAEHNGKVTKLSDYVGKGKYVLVDFWASWCGPCRHEIPNLIKVYEKYKGDKFEVLGVATWDKPADTEKAISDMKIPYPQILNAQKAGSDAYGISGIPQIILFGPDGTILKRNLRGEAMEKAIEEALK